MELEQQQERAFRPGAIVAGAILLGLGVAMILDTTGAIDIRVGRMITPLILIAIGASIMFDKGAFVAGRRRVRVIDADGRELVRLPRRGSSNSGFWLIGIGVWMMVSQMHLFGLNYGNSWPLFIILSGLMMVIRGVR
jgi:hypothetical protein